ncbi:uncharacterized protein N7459_006249 [Penicillium hispanicum]|uniref:uncharacterized protein n=1 Tax=Penicillium hispanicum TaxID=1080232 RepID=UPI00253FC9AF|nr:uncharacterized protein N7459_006249 [Penicillium hispanicum]KAJ5580264.1 hypothetical protein N7459_006249 [Penicillium hispanicum]
MESTPIKYGKRQTDGQRIQKWMEQQPAASDNCPIQSCTLQLDEIEAWKPVTKRDNVPSYVAGELQRLGITTDDGPLDKILVTESAVVANRANDKINSWEGRVAPGTIWMERIFRRDGHYTSQIAHAVYAGKYPIDTLKRVLVTDVRNLDTKPFVQNKLYVRRNGLRWPVFEPQSWERGTPQYEGLLGTRIGKVVAYLVLGAFERGSRRISRIVTWIEEEMYDLQMRFDIEEIEERAGEASLSGSSDEPLIRRKRKAEGEAVSSDSSEPLVLRKRRATEGAAGRQKAPTPRKTRGLRRGRPQRGENA